MSELGTVNPNILDVLTKNAATGMGSKTTSLVYGDTTQPAPTGTLDPTSFASIQPAIPLLQKYFRPEDIGKAAWTSHWENPEGRPDTVSSAGENPPQGRATGYFQILPQYVDANGRVINPDRPTQQQLKDPETNIRYASQLVYGPGGKDSGAIAKWSDWQDNPQPGEPIWGALAGHPYPGDANVHLPDHPLPDDYQQKKSETQTILPLLQTAQSDQIAAIQAFQADPNNYHTVDTGGHVVTDLLAKVGIGDTAKGEKVPTPEANKKLNDMRTELSKTIGLSQTMTLFSNILEGLPGIIADKTTNIKTADDFFNYLKSTPGNIALSQVADGLSPDQKAYISKAINTLSPYLNSTGPKPISTSQLSQFLAASKVDAPSTRVSLAGLSIDSIRSILTTLPGENIKLPPGLTEDALRQYYAPSQFASPEAQKEIAGLQGQASNLIAGWIRQDNQYQAIKLGLLNPDSLPILQDREMNIGQWTLDKLGFWSKNVARPLSALGIMALDLSPISKGYDLLGVDNPVSSLLDKIGLNPHTEDLRKNFLSDIKQGQNPWQAAGNSFEQWNANGLVKFFAETAGDPLTYVGFGVYTPATRGIPILGRTVEAVENGLRLGFENPVIAKVGLTATSASLGYQATGDWKGALVGAAGGGVLGPAAFGAVLRGIPLYSERQLLRMNIMGEDGLVPTLDKAIAITNHLPEARGASAAEIRNTIELGTQQIRENPLLAHTTPEGNAVKGILQKISPVIDAKEVEGWRGVAEEPHPGTMVARTPVTTTQLHDINLYADYMLDSARGVLSPAEVGDKIATTLGMPKTAGPKIAEILTQRIETNLSRLEALTSGNNPDTMYKGIVDASLKGYTEQIRSPLWNHGLFQGNILSLQNTLKPITRSGIWKFLSTVQSGITNATLKYAGFGITHFVEIPYRSLVGGLTPEIVINADKEGEALLFHGWNTASPLAIRSHKNTLKDVVASVSTTGDPLPESALTRAKGSMRNLKQWVSVPGDIMSKAYGNTKASAYNRMVIDEVAKAAPASYLGMKQNVDKIMGQLADSGMSPKELESLRSVLVNYSFRPDAPELLRKMSSDVPTLERKAFHAAVQEKLDQYTNIESPYKAAIMQQVQRGNPEPTAGIADSMLEHEVAKSDLYGQQLKEFSQSFIDALQVSKNPARLPRIEGVNLPEAPSVIEAPSQAYHGSGSELSSFQEGMAEPLSLYGPGIYLTSDPQVSKGYADAAERRLSRRRAQYIKDFPTQRDIDLYPEGVSTVHQVDIQPNQKLLNLEQPFPPETEALFRGKQSWDSDAWEAAANAIAEGKKGTEVYKAFKDELSDLGTHNTDAAEALQEFNNVLQQNGYDGLTHVGGGRYNRKDLNRHNVTIIFDENKVHPASATLGTDSIPGLLRELNIAHESAASSLADIVQSGSERASSLSTEEGKNTHWERVNSASDSYAKSASENIRNMVDALRPHIDTLPADQQRIFHAALDNIIDRSSLINSTRAKLDATITDFMTAHSGHRPHGAQWDSISQARSSIWNSHFDSQDKLLAKYNALVNDYGPHYGPPPTATNGLTLQHLAQWYHSSGDEIAQSLVELQGLTRKGTFVNSIKGTADAEALKAGTTAEQLGWSEEALGNLYDQIRVRLNTEPSESSVLIQAKKELDSVRQDIQAARLTHGWKPETATNINDAFAAHASYIEQNPFDGAAIQKAYEQSRLRYENTYIDYSHDNIFDAVLKGIFPFWVHQSQRWPWLFNQVIAHPGIAETIGRYQDYTDKGYIHIPGVDVAFNILRGNSLMGGFGPLFTQFPANYESGILGEFGSVYDQIGKAGFYPGFWATLPLNLKGIVDFNVPAPVSTAINLTSNIGNAVGLDPHLLEIRDHLFPSKFRDYYIGNIVAEMSQEQNLGLNGEKVRADIREGTATPEEQILWEAAEKKFSRYQILFDQTGVMKLDPQAKREAALEAAKFIQDKTGVTPEQQDALTSRLGSSGLRLSDVLPLDPQSTKQLYEMSKFKYWAGLTTILQPSELQQTQDKITSFWDQVNTLEEKARTTGFTSRDGKTTYESLDSLDKKFRAGELPAKEWNIQQANTRSQIAAEIEGLKNSKEFKDIPISLEERTKYAQENNTTMPVEHPAKELLNLYYSITPKNDPQTGLPNWEDYFASVDGLINTLPTDKKNYLLDYIQRNWTPTQKLLWQTNTNYLRSYNNIREGILQALVPEQQAFIRQYSTKLNDPATIDNLPESQKKLLTDYSSAIQNAEARYRQLSPMTDAWLYYWGKRSSLETETARRDYNDLIRAHPGPHSADIAIVKKTQPLTPLDTGP